MFKYVEFMKKYEESDGTDLSIISEYSDMMEEYSDMCDEFDDWDFDDLNTKEQAYYLDVVNNVNKKLLEISE